MIICGKMQLPTISATNVPKGGIRKIPESVLAATRKLKRQYPEVFRIFCAYRDIQNVFEDEYDYLMVMIEVKCGVKNPALEPFNSIFREFLGIENIGFITKKEIHHSRSRGGNGYSDYEFTRTINP